MNEARWAARIATVRAFNRLYTGVIGVLDESPGDPEYSLTEARVVFELSQRERTRVADLRKRLDLDPGYTSRLLSKLAARGLVMRARCDVDARCHVVSLTDAGRAAFVRLNERTVEQVSGLLQRFGEAEQRRLLSAMGTITGLVGERELNPALVLRPPRAGDLGWVVHRHGVLYAQEYGWDQKFEALVARVAAEYVDGSGGTRQAGWIAEVDGERAGSVFCMLGRDDKTAKLRLLIVEPAARGLGVGVGTRLVAESVEFARGSGYSAIQLRMADQLTAARGVFQRAGFRLVGEEPMPAFGRDLTNQTWRLEL